MGRVFLEDDEFVQPEDQVILDLMNSSPELKDIAIEEEERSVIDEIKMILRNIDRMSDIAINQKVNCINISVRIFKREGINNSLVEWAEKCFDEINFLLQAKRRGYERVVEYRQLEEDRGTNEYYAVNLLIDERSKRKKERDSKKIEDVDDNGEFGD